MWPNSPGRGTTKRVHSTAPVAALRASTRPWPPTSPFARPTNTLPRAYIGAVVTTSARVRTSLPTRVAQTRSPVSRLRAMTSPLRVPKKTWPSSSPTPCHEGTRPASGSGSQRQTSSPVRASNASMFADYLAKLRSTPDGDGSLLDNMLLLYGCGMSDSNAHSPLDLPVLLLGGCGGQLEGGRHLRYKGDPLMPNLLVTLMDKLGVPVERLGKSDGRLSVERLTGV